MQSRRIYIATSKTNKDRQRQIAAMLAEHGWEQTYDWTAHRDLVATDCALDAVARNLVSDELRAVGRADVVLVILPGGPGTHVELGAALALRKPVILLATRELLAPNGVPVAAYARTTWIWDTDENVESLPKWCAEALHRPW